MAFDYDTRSTGKIIAQPIAASDGLLGVFSGTAATPPNFTVVAMGKINDVAQPFGGSGFSELVHIFDTDSNQTFRMRVSPALQQFGTTITNTAGTTRSTLVTLTGGGTNLTNTRNQRYTWASTFTNSDRILRSYVVWGGTPTVDVLATTAITASVGMRLATNVTFGAVADNSMPGFVSLFAVISGVLSQAQIEAIHAANDPGWVLHTHRTSILWATCYGLSGETPGTTFPLPGANVAADNMYVYNSGTQTNWIGVPPSAPTVTGTIPHVLASAAGHAINTSIVPDGGEDITTEVQNAVVNPAAHEIGKAWANGGTFTKPVHALCHGNSRMSRHNTDIMNRQTQNDSYHSSQPAGVAQNYVEGFAARFPAAVVGSFIAPRVSGTAFSPPSGVTSHSLAGWSGTLPATGGPLLKTGSGTDAPDVDFSRLFITNNTSTGRGPGQYVYIPSGGGIDFPFSNCGGLQPGDPRRVWVAFLEWPNSDAATLQKSCHASSSSTVPFGSAAARWADATLHGSESAPIALDTTEVGGLGVVSYSASTLTLNSDPGIITGGCIVVNRDGTPCIGIVNNPSSAPAFGIEGGMGAGTGRPTLDDIAYYGPQPRIRWAYVDFDGTETPTPWRAIRVRAGTGKLGVIVTRIGVQKLNPDGTAAPGIITWPVGWSGQGHTPQINAMPQIDGADGLTPLERWAGSLLEPMRFGGGIALGNIMPAQQSSSVAAIGAMIDAYLAGGWTTQEIAFAADTANANNGSAFATQSYQDFAAYGKIVGPAKKILAVNTFKATGTPFSQLCFGHRADTSHVSTEGNENWADNVARVYAPVAAGGGGGAMPELTGNAVRRMLGISGRLGRPLGGPR